MYNWFNSKRTQNLYRRQVKNIIKVWGIPIIYIMKKEGSSDRLYGEDTALSYEKTFPTKMLLENAEFYEGNNQTFNNFLTVLDNSMRFKVEIDTFSTLTGLDRPQEGDLIAIALSPGLKKTNPNNKGFEIFEIKGVEPRNDFYALGTFFSHVIECHRLEYNHQRFNTGIPEIDILNEITDKEENYNKIGDNSTIDDLNINGVEVFSNITGKVEDSNRPVTEENKCSPTKSQQQENVEWDPNNPYGTGD